MKPLLNRAVLLTVLVLLQSVTIQAVLVDLAKAVVVTPGNLTGPEKKAVAMLLNEVAKRTTIRLPCIETWPQEPGPVIAVGLANSLAALAGPFADAVAAGPEPKAEGYRLRILLNHGQPAVLVAGNDSRGVLFGVGRLLRELRTNTGSMTLPDNLDITSAPKYPLRGHQLGYRPKTNSYDAWVWFPAMDKDSPDWLTGIVSGPQIRLSMPQLRAAVPAKYPIRHYPDITHTRQCQYAVPDWDAAFAMTEGRECINPRPEDEAAIFRAVQPYTIGFLTYSEGCNDDVNKAVWSALGWNPDARVVDILREYSR